MDEKNILLIRADANVRMGTGHVMRCIALGQAWQDAVERAECGSLKPESSDSIASVVFVCAEIPDALAERVRSEGFDLVRIDAECGVGCGVQVRHGNWRIQNLLPHFLDEGSGIGRVCHPQDSPR